ncbi:MAG TPA: DUF4394 domain-containing protein [Pyrinomonadaceae bacterium]|nr:DUF4394 domain-containing protein [Pyrinomonadaceae bacterium]
MNKSTRSARRLATPILIALAVLMSTITLPGYSSTRAARRAERRAAAGDTRSNRQPGTPSKAQSKIKTTNPATAAAKDGEDAEASNHTPEPRGKIAFASDRDGNFEIYVMNPDGSGQIRLTNDPGEDVQPAWSPDGSKIAFVSNRAGSNDIYIMNADGSNLFRLINNPANERSPTWHPSGQNIAFVSDQTGNDEIYTSIVSSLPFSFDLPLGPGRTVSDHPADDIDPAYSPDGTILAFASNRDGNYEIYISSPVGLNPTRLTDAPDDDTHPSWSRGKITFQSERSGNDDIFVMDADGQNEINVTNNAALDVDPARTADNQRIVFASTRDGNFEIYAGNAPTATLRRLTSNVDATDFNPSIQPLAVPANSGARVFTAMLDGSQEVPPTNSPARGIGTVVLSADEMTARVSLTFSGLTSAQTMAHIHGFAPPGTNAPVIFPLPNGTFSDFQISLTPVQVRNLKAGLMYFNVHTENFPGGEIRGQINAASSPSTVAPHSNAIALTTGNRLLRFNTSAPDDILSSVVVTGLQTDESLLAIENISNIGTVLGLGSTGRLYRVDSATGVATQIGSGTFAVPLNGSEFGMAFGPNGLRVVSDSGQNFRLNSETGMVLDGDPNTPGTQPDAPLAYNAELLDPNAGRTPRVSGAAAILINVGQGTLYDIDYDLDVLVTQNPENAGTLNTVGTLGVDASKFIGFDIANNSQTAFAALASPTDTASRLYSIDLNTGAATLIGNFGSTELIRGLVVANTTFARLISLDITVSEGAGSVLVGVTRGGDTTGESLIDFDTNDGTATERRDYTTAAGVLRFEPGEGIDGIRVFITDDRFVEENETFTVTLRNPTGATFNDITVATITIVDNDTAASPTNPIDEPTFFVTQHYLDFLNRAPEAEGLAAWLRVLTNCRAGDTSCDRVAVSSAFFLSPEYQTKGFYAIRFYLAAFGRLPTYREFIRDLYRLNGATAAESIAARGLFAEEFTESEEFTRIYDALSNANFVDRIIQNTGVTISNRDALVADLDAGRKTRAQVLREIVESNAVAAATFNRAFVLSQYFGYLRRDPDTAGFNAWLAYLNANPNDYRTMVNGFVNSIEYRLRFGTP